MADRDIVAILAGEVGLAFEPFADAADTPARLVDFLELLGWQFTTPPAPVTELSTSIDAVLAIVTPGDVGTDQIPALLSALADAFGAIADLESASGLSDDFKAEFPRQLVDYLLVEYLFSYRPAWGFFLYALGIVRYDAVGPQAGRGSFVRRTFAFEDLGDLLSDPLGYLKTGYEWGTPDFEGDRLTQALTGLLKAWNFRLRELPVDPPQVLAQLKAGALPSPDAFDSAVRLMLLGDEGDPDFGAGVGLFLLSQTAADEPGFALLPFASATFDEAIAISDSVTLAFDGEVDLTGGVGIFVRPNEDVQFQAGLASGAPTPVSGTFTVSLLLGQVGNPILILGDPATSRVEFAGVSTTGGVRLSGGGVEVFTELALKGGKVVVNPSSSDSDGFLASLLPAGGVQAAFDLAVGFSTTRGIYFGGAGGFEIAVPTELQVGPIDVQQLAVAIRPAGGDIPVNVSATFTADLSVLKATVDKVGFTAAFAFPEDRRGNLGPVDLELQFLPPTGLGLAIDSGSVHGGGFISFDPTAGRYFGALQLSIYDIAVNAFGLIDTKVSGVDYSFVVVISAQFTPIQLGFGFTLNGVGGLVGINRSIDTAALASLVRAGQSEELLFPKNVVADAPTIVRDLTTVFPATQGRYVFGPLGKLGWGTPTLITGEIGIILEVPGLVVVILGEVKCLLPKPDAALVKLNLSIDGELDFPNKTFAMDAALHDSVINGFPVSGQMAMRVSWGTQPNFVFSIGGFHPAYTPPPNFPKLQPMALDLGSHGAARISVSGFFAVTSNTVQVGGSATLHASGSGISLDASVSVKALFVFQPFSFEADIDASVKISFHGYGPSVHLSGTLAGPSPWHVKGEVCVSILWWDACLGFDVTFGGNQQITQPAIDPWLGVAATDSSPAIIGLQTALSDPGNWSGALIPGTVSSVTRAQGTDTLVDPAGGLTVRQKTAPVETPNPLTKFGVARTTSPISFSNVQATLGDVNAGVKLTALEAVSEFFAPAQFFNMDDGKKLSSAGFEHYQAGYLFATAQGNAQGGSTTSPALTIDTYFIAGNGTITGPVETQPPPNNSAKVGAANTRSAVAKNGLTLAGTRRFVDRGLVEAFTEKVPTFVITSNATLVKTAGAPAAAVRSATLIALDAFRAQNVEQAASVQVAAFHEAA